MIIQLMILRLRQLCSHPYLILVRIFSTLNAPKSDYLLFSLKPMVLPIPQSCSQMKVRKNNLERKKKSDQLLSTRFVSCLGLSLIIVYLSLNRSREGMTKSLRLLSVQTFAVRFLLRKAADELEDFDDEAELSETPECPKCRESA